MGNQLFSIYTARAQNARKILLGVQTASFQINPLPVYVARKLIKQALPLMILNIVLSGNTLYKHLRKPTNKFDDYPRLNIETSSIDSVVVE